MAQHHHKTVERTTHVKTSSTGHRNDYKGGFRRFCRRRDNKCCPGRSKLRNRWSATFCWSFAQRSPSPVMSCAALERGPNAQEPDAWSDQAVQAQYIRVIA